MKRKRKSMKGIKKELDNVRVGTNECERNIRSEKPLAFDYYC